MSEANAPEKIIINGQEYDPEDVAQKIELGNKYRQLETDWNTPLDKLMPEYTKATQERATYQKQLAEREAELEKYRQQAKAAETPKEKLDVIKAAREAGLADLEWLKEQGYVRKDDLDQYLEQKLTAKEQQQANAKAILDIGNKYKEEFNGSDGRPAYNDRAVLAYASSYGFFKEGVPYEQALKNAYEDMNKEPLSKWQEQQIAKSQRPGLTTLRPGGKKTPERTKMTDDNLAAGLDEMLKNMNVGLD